MPGLLIVDDEEIVRRTLAQAIARGGLDLEQVAEASNGEQAVSMTRQMRPDIVLMDVRMPGLDGLEALRIIRAESPATRVLILTAYDEFTFAQQALRLGAVDYLLKPVRPATLLEVLSRVQAQIAEQPRAPLEGDAARDRWHNLLPLAESRLVADLVGGLMREQASIDPILSHLGKNIQQPAVIVVDVVPCHSMSQRAEAEQLDCFPERFSDVVGDAVPDRDGCLVGQMARGTAVAIVSTGRKLADADELRLLGHAIHHAVKMYCAEHCARRCGWSNDAAAVTVSIGRRCSGLQSVATSYAEAIHAQSHRLYMGRDSVVLADDVVTLDLNRPFYPIEFERELLARVRRGDQQGGQETLAHLVDHMLGHPAMAPAVIRTRLAELLALISRAVIDAGAPPSEALPVAHHQRSLLAQAQGAGQIRAWAVNSLSALMNQIAAEHQQDVAIKRAVEYMIQNRHRADLTLDEVARAVYLSPSHLRHLFRDRLGASYIKHLTSLRMREARRLLRTTDLTVAAVAEAVGYDSSYFYRVFRRHNGTTPAAYRRTSRLNC
jgi:two-component system response regulator YesN